MNDSQLSTPVLLLIFNRLDTTKQVLAAIANAQPTRLYVAADGALQDRIGEAEKVQAVRDYVMSHINWNCEIKTLFRDKNLGCRVAVSSAIDWFFEHELEGIILEDDCVPDASFFPFVEELLTRYRDDERIMVIAGNHFHGEAHKPPYSYFFSRYNHCWGWASWRRAWQYYDHEMNQWLKLRDTDWLLTIGDGNRDFQRYWTRIFDRAYAQKVDSWAYRWTFSCWAQSGLTILPACNLVKNIGFDEDATHTKGNSGRLSKLPLESLTFPLSHPPSIIRDYVADRWSDLNHFKLDRINQIKKKLLKVYWKMEYIIKK